MIADIVKQMRPGQIGGLNMEMFLQYSIFP